MKKIIRAVLFFFRSPKIGPLNQNFYKFSWRKQLLRSKNIQKRKFFHQVWKKSLEPVYLFIYFSRHSFPRLPKIDSHNCMNFCSKQLIYSKKHLKGSLNIKCEKKMLKPLYKYVLSVAFLAFYSLHSFGSTMIKRFYIHTYPQTYFEKPVFGLKRSRNMWNM